MIDDEELLDDIKRVKKEVGRSPSSKEYKEHGKHELKTVQNRFGTWNKAKEVAGLETFGGYNEFKREKEEVNVDKLIELFEFIVKNPLKSTYELGRKVGIDDNKIGPYITELREMGESDTGLVEVSGAKGNGKAKTVAASYEGNKYYFKEAGKFEWRDN